jgi:hypothetical protein
LCHRRNQAKDHFQGSGPKVPLSGFSREGAPRAIDPAIKVRTVGEAASVRMAVKI